MTPHVGRRDDRTATLVLEVELPNMHVEDMRHDNPDWQRWLSDVDADPADAKAVGEEILHNIGDVHYGLLTVEIAGHKGGSEIERVPVVMVGARVEDRKPEADPEGSSRLAHEVDEPFVEARLWAAMDRAELNVYRRLARQLIKEFPGQIGDLASAAVAEANRAADDAERREDERAERLA